MVRPKNPFRAWLYTDDLDVISRRLGVTKTTIRQWRTGRGHPFVRRHRRIKLEAAKDGTVLTTDHLLPEPK